ncbi:MAG: hypothetical protein AUH85_07250 [Chloroflexi bacterium 13_1_40CM_4_68_4]|nr:MAG: hypothetical protein AUH85_07250 [Chloroflexi bacterium 13_1_40CM_4_68_4]
MLRVGLAQLSGLDPDLAAIVTRFGPPPLWAREPGFATMIRIILEQQVSLASASAAYARLAARVGRVTPSRIRDVDEESLRAAGLTRQKARYIHALAESIVRKDFHFGHLAALDDDAAREALITLEGVGRWSADIYLLMALLRPDVWPASDLALASAVRQVKRLRQRPTTEELERIGERWRPWRAVAARLLWHQYLSARKT